MLQYRELPNRILEFHNTETPLEHQGKGIAKLLVKEGFKYAAENRYRIKPTCWYVLKYVEDEATEEEQNLSTTMALRVQHCKSAMEFFINFSNGSRARLQYRELPGRILDFDHTETPPDQQGKGVAKMLVQEGFKYAAENNYKIIPTCWYVAKYANEMATADEKKLVCQ
ncbi:unnamed protein product [Haemonchus placei]|uniref:Protein NATD1 n=1 Tax=Haemonchus placei TaxID=6290 RepID=A0A3P7THB4_HAEPC|nr:unnamed protein product [Haemonchus placei]